MQSVCILILIAIILELLFYYIVMILENSIYLPRNINKLFHLQFCLFANPHVSILHLSKLTAFINLEDQYVCKMVYSTRNMQLNGYLISFYCMHIRFYNNFFRRMLF